MQSECCGPAGVYQEIQDQYCEPVWPSSKAEGPRFESASALLSLQKLWSVDIVL